MPDIKVEWFHNVHLQLTVIDRSKDAKGSTSLIAQVANQQLAPVQVALETVEHSNSSCCIAPSLQVLALRSERACA